MKPDKPSSEDLRRRAEARVNSLAPPTLEDGSVLGEAAALQALRNVHELQVHQLEVEMQNEELHRIQQDLVQALEDYTELYDFAPVGYLSLQQDGRITRANLEAGRLLGVERARLMTRRFADFLADSDKAAFAAYLKQVFLAEPLKPLESRVPRPGAPPLCVLMEAALSADGRLCRIVLTDITRIREAEAGLQESHERLSKLAWRLPGMLYQFQLFPDGRTCIPYSSEGIRTLFGLEPEAVREDGQALFAVVHPEDGAALMASIQQSALTLEPWHRDFRVVLPEIGTRWLSGAAQPEPLADGSILWHGFASDITERLEAERALAASEQQALLERRHLSEVIWGTDAGTWDWNVQTGETSFNERWAGMLGYALEEISPSDIGTWFQLVHPEDRQHSDELLQRCFRGEAEDYQCDCRMRHKDGHWVWILDRGRVVEWTPEGQPLRMSGTHLDISERKRAELALAEALAFNQQIISSAQEGIVVYDREGRLALFNPFMEAMMGVSAKQVLGKLPGEAFPFLEGLGVPEGIGRALRGEQVHHPPAPWALAASGRSGWVSSTQAPLRDDRGEIVGVIAMVTDETELHRAQENEKQLEADLQHAQKLESLGSLAGGVAHDMNNVLAAIQAVSETLHLTHGADPSLLRFLEIIDRASARGRDLVKGLTNFARKDLREPKPLDLNALVREESELLHRITLQKVEVVLGLEEGLPWVLGEWGPLTSALMNLCVNAVDAMPTGGTLTLRTRGLAGAQVELVVQDTGTGMTPEVLARAMEPFFTTKPIGKGTGLGLAMAYATVKAHGGTLSVHSEPGQGTRVTLRLPSCAATGAPGVSPAAEGPKTASLEILLVDDDELIRASIPAMVESFGHHVITAAGGQAGLDMLDAGLEVQLVILDLNMPGMNGLEALKQLRQRQPWLPVLLATGHLDAESSRVLQQAGRALSISKPYTMEELDGKLQEILRLEGL
ncbi:MAG: PAS domain S-box protein [Holophagaceae bacterium]|nr:PAS domain S-box protein [Holophagaceae bacterium]